MFFKITYLLVAGIASLALISEVKAQTFTDIKGNVYEQEINRATELNIVAGFPNQTFRPNQPVKREEAISMIVEALGTLTEIDLKEAPTTRTRPYLDVDENRWSYDKITWAQWNIQPEGSATGNFRPDDYITRTELVDFLRRAAEFLQVKLGKSSFLTPTVKEITFSDVSGYELQLTRQMSAYCNVASALNEKGDKFAPKKSANRDYTAAAIIRMLDCVNK
ncbi:S-layer homology domain-containing protein [Cyanobacterium aponinum]|uniref:S-layer homology domain-containing protein n=1 Tax=Cyanobacterium aponinum 0216 TaxID=2676140 RepID=A0A844GXD6_9CHRO|nr:S-layer homology domain-containing protein [Cyanobacterium aponinum]MTF38845.1 S-layer homology domain-containing protein [Cyanobacterium aponinum 0216]